MDIKLEGRQVEIGAELRERIETRLDSLDKRFGPITHARVSVEKKSHVNDQRAEVTALVNLAGHTVAVTRESSTVVAAVNEALETLTEDVKTYVERSRKTHR